MWWGYLLVSLRYLNLGSYQLIWWGHRLGSADDETGKEGGAMEAHATVEAGAADPERDASKTTPGAAPLQRPDGAEPELSTLSVPDGAPRLTGSATPDSPVQASTVTPSIPTAAPSARPAPSASPALPPPLRHSRPPGGPERTTAPPVAPTVASVPSHVVFPAPGSGKGAVASLDERSSRRHK